MFASIVGAVVATIALASVLGWRNLQGIFAEAEKAEVRQLRAYAAECSEALKLQTERVETEYEGWDADQAREEFDRLVHIRVEAIKAQQALKDRIEELRKAA